MTETSPGCVRFISRKTHGIRIAVTFFLASAILGCVIPALLLRRYAFQIQLQNTNPFSNCITPGDDFFRCAILCRSTILQILICFVSAYAHFEIPMLAVLFTMRGLATGMAACFLTYTASGFSFWMLFLVHVLISCLFLIFLYFIHTDSGQRPFRESSTLCMIFGGVCCLLPCITLRLLF